MRLFYVLLLSTVAFTADRYVSTTGNNTADGSISAPWLTIAHACSTVVSGDVIYLRGLV